MPKPDPAQDGHDHSGALLRDGCVVLNGLYSRSAVEDARRCVLNHRHLLRNTRPRASSGHLAGFHRHPALEHLHLMISSNPVVSAVLERASGCASVRSIGLSDITVNRSQPWHVDLLRGRYRHHLNSDICWGPHGGGVYKVLMYLQPGGSLRVVPGAHLQPISLESDEVAKPTAETRVDSIAVEAGSIVLMDIRLPHRGSSEEELGPDAQITTAKILISTVLGGDRRPLTSAMERGNLERLLDWETRHGLGA